MPEFKSINIFSIIMLNVITIVSLWLLLPRRILSQQIINKEIVPLIFDDLFKCFHDE